MSNLISDLITDLISNLGIASILWFTCKVSCPYNQNSGHLGQTGVYFLPSVHYTFFFQFHLLILILVGPFPSFRQLDSWLSWTFLSVWHCLALLVFSVFLALLNCLDSSTTLQSRTGPVQGQNRDFPVKFSTQGKPRFHYREPLFSLQGPLFSLQGFPCEKNFTGKTLFSLQGMVCSEHLSQIWR